MRNHSTSPAPSTSRYYCLGTCCCERRSTWRGECRRTSLGTSRCETVAVTRPQARTIRRAESPAHMELPQRRPHFVPGPTRCHQRPRQGHDDVQETRTRAELVKLRQNGWWKVRYRCTNAPRKSLQCPLVRASRTKFLDNNDNWRCHGRTVIRLGKERNDEKLKKTERLRTEKARGEQQGQPTKSQCEL